MRERDRVRGYETPFEKVPKRRGRDRSGSTRLL